MENFDLGANLAGGKVEKQKGIERIASIFLLTLTFLLPLFFVPGVSFPLQFSKVVLLSVLVLAVFCIWVVARLKDGKFVIPTSPILIALSVVVGLFVVSSLFSGSASSSLLGQALEVGTTLNLLLVSLLAFLIPMMFRVKEQIFASYLAFLASFFLISIFHIVRLMFGPGVFSMGIFNDTVSNSIGKWNDLGVFFGISALLSLITVELLSLNRFFKAVVYLTLLISLFFLAVVNFSTIWFVVGLFALIFLVYLISFGSSTTAAVTSTDGVEEGGTFATTHKARRIPTPSIFVLLVSVIFVVTGGSIGNQISNAFKISQVEARPSWGATFDVARKTLVTDPLFGSGPNQFTQEWLKYKPDGINGTIFWNVDFNYGVGLIPTFLATSGILGTMAWVAFFLVFLLAGFRAILLNLSDRFSQYLITSSFFVSLFLWIFNIFYIPSLTIFSLTFIFTGLFIASLMVAKLAPSKSLSFGQDPRAGFVSVLLLILLLISGVTLGYVVIQKYAASVFFQKGIISFNTEGDLTKAEKLVERAVSLSPADQYYRFLTEITLMRMNTLLNKKADTVTAESVRKDFQTLLGTALGHARQAVALNPKSYENFVSLGRVYEAVTPLKIEGAYESAKVSYEQALTLNPHSPAIHLTLARLEVAKNDNAKAREQILAALREKNNYTEAIFLLSQIEAQEGNIKGAISSVEAAATIAPDDASVFFQLGLLRFNDKSYPGAVGALERAVALNPAYANAKYFLGLSYAKVKKEQDAIKQFTDLKVTNPDNKEIDLILKNLKAGREPFVDALPPVDATPEKRSKLPVSEKGTTRKAAATLPDEQ